MRNLMQLVENAQEGVVLSLIKGVLSGRLLVHVRKKDGTEFHSAIYPSAGELLRSTDDWQTAVEIYGDGPELIFFADDFSWARGGAHGGDPSQLEAVFVEKNGSIIQYLDDGVVRTASGKTIRYTMSDMADYENPLFSDVPAGVEPGDWFTNEPQDVVSVVPIPKLLALLPAAR